MHKKYILGAGAILAVVAILVGGIYAILYAVDETLFEQSYAALRPAALHKSFENFETFSVSYKSIADDPVTVDGDTLRKAMRVKNWKVLRRTIEHSTKETAITIFFSSDAYLTVYDNDTAHGMYLAVDRCYRIPKGTYETLKTILA